MKKFHYPWTPALNRLKRTAKKEGWPLVQYYDNGYSNGYLKKRGPKWSQVVILKWRKKKVGKELDAFTGKTISIYKSKYDSTTKRILNTHVTQPFSGSKIDPEKVRRKK